ncbi:hypothetical protein ACHAPS_008345 [Verticillium nonalfalfae]
MRPGPPWPVIRLKDSVADSRYRIRRRVIWRWTNGFCHRDAKYEATYDASERNWEACLDGQANCSGRPHGADNGRFQGVMSFLLSSKQSHDELLGILYGTSVILLESMPLIESLCAPTPARAQLLGPGVGLVTSLRITIELVLFDKKCFSSAEHHRRRFVNILDGLGPRFPSLKRLALFFDNQASLTRFDPAKEIGNLDLHLFLPLLAMSTRLAGVEMTVWVTAPMYQLALTGFSWQRDEAEPGLVEYLIRADLMWYPFFNSWDDGQRSGEGYWVRKWIDKPWKICPKTGRRG